MMGWTVMNEKKNDLPTIQHMNGIHSESDNWAVQK